MWSAIGELGVALLKAGLELGTATAARRAEIRAELARKWGALQSSWDDFEARADDRVHDAMSDADSKPPRPVASSSEPISSEPADEPTKS